jgi:ubiquitin-protein ligase
MNNVVHVAVSLVLMQCVVWLLKNPNIDDVLDQDIADLFESDKATYLERERAWTSK